MEARKILIYLALKYKGNREDIYKEISIKREKFSNEVKEQISKLEVDAVTILDEEYPTAFKKITNPPFVLFYKGNKNLLESKNNTYLSVVGSRNATSYGLEMVEKTLKNLSKRVVVVSGLASGIDTKAHKTALNNGYGTIAVLGSGINYIYPKENVDLYNDIIKNEGLIISEYPDEVEPTKESFLIRNRLIAGLGKCTLLIESYTKSGAFNTACQAATFGRNVACVPQRANLNSNCNKLIKDGAYLVENSKDLELLL